MSKRNHYGDFIKFQRNKLGMKQEDIAKLIGISRSHVCLIETGKRKIGQTELKLILEKLDTTIEEVSKQIIEERKITSRQPTLNLDSKGKNTFREKIIVFLEQVCEELKGTDEKRIFEITPGVRVVVDK